MGAEFLFMDDNARPHRANIVDECLQSEDITRMGWPAYSPDLNPIEHVWDMLGRRTAARQPPPTCLPELRRALLDEWCNIPQVQIDNLILSMPRRWNSVGKKTLFKSGLEVFRTRFPQTLSLTPLVLPQLYCWEDVLLQAVILAPDEGGIETSWKSAGGTDAGKAIGNAGAQMLVKLLELERLLELDHVSTLVSLSGDFSLFLR
ncbi:transposable element Tc3 transposase [Trichonephila clavipes]|nr:transposable element Tc3 transposase [Trichonephila clavipes]